MPTAFHTTVLDHPLETVWALIRDFNNYPLYIEGVTESVIEDDRAGDEVGAVRRFTYNGNEMRQRLLALEEMAHCLTYAGIGAFDPGPEAGIDPARYEGTIALSRITDGGRTLLDWSVTADAAPDDVEAWRKILLPMVLEWCGSLARALDQGVRGKA